MKRWKLLLICLLWVAAESANVFGQDTLPNDPAALMKMGYERNGLAGADVKPWHLRGTYRSYSPDGKPDYDGTFEEWWYSPTEYKLSWSGSQFTQTDYAVGGVLKRTGQAAWPSGPEMLLREMLIAPLPDAAMLTDFKLHREKHSAGKVKLECVTMKYPVPGNLAVSGDYFPFACFDSSLPALRVFSTGGSIEAAYDNLVSFQGHYLARHLVLDSGGHPFAELSLDLIEAAKEGPAATIVPPQNAVAVDLTQIDEKAETLAHFPILLRKAIPAYPVAARSARVQGKVDMDVVIAEDGHVSDLQVMDGPPALRKAAEDAVRQWVYRPFIVMGRARPVKSSIHVIFSLG